MLINCVVSKCWLSVSITTVIAYSAINSAHAQQLPNSGTLLQDVERQQLSPRETDKSAIPSLKQPVELKDDTVFPISGVRLTGNTLFDQSTLEAAYVDLIGETATLSELQKICNAIGRYYQDRGYPFVHAVVPRQSLDDGVVQIKVVEPILQDTNLENNSAISDHLVASTLASLPTGKVMQEEDLEQALLLLSELPGSSVTSTLVPGQQVGSSALNVQVDKSASVRGLVSLNNHGSEALNRERLSAAVQVLNPLNHGDKLDLSVLSSGRKLGYAALQYGAIVNGSGTELSVGGSRLRYNLGNSLAEGDAETVNLFVRQPLIRSYRESVTGKLQLSYNLYDDLAGGTSQNKREVSKLDLSVDGRLRGALSDSGVSSWRAAMSFGELDYQNASAIAGDTAQAEGGFHKLQLSFGHAEPLGRRGEVAVSLQAQYASQNLDSSEKMVLGGAGSVRGYDVSSLSGDHGIHASLAYRHGLVAGNYGSLQAEVFIDAAEVTENAEPLQGGNSTNSVQIYAAGLGLNWFGPDQWQGKLSVATDIGDKPEELSDVDTTRAWLQITKGFEF